MKFWRALIMAGILDSLDGKSGEWFSHYVDSRSVQAQNTNDEKRQRYLLRQIARIKEFMAAEKDLEDEIDLASKQIYELAKSDNADKIIGIFDGLRRRYGDTVFRLRQIELSDFRETGQKMSDNSQKRISEIIAYAKEHSSDRLRKIIVEYELIRELEANDFSVDKTDGKFLVKKDTISAEYSYDPQLGSEQIKWKWTFLGNVWDKKIGSAFFNQKNTKQTIINIISKHSGHKF